MTSIVAFITNTNKYSMMMEEDEMNRNDIYMILNKMIDNTTLMKINYSKSKIIKNKVNFNE